MNTTTPAQPNQLHPEHQQVQDFTRTVADALGPSFGFRYLPVTLDSEGEPFRPHLGRIGNGDKVLTFRTGYDLTGRYEVAGEYPRCFDGSYPRVGGYRESEPKITVGATRDPDAVAKDVLRRLWPQVEAWHERVLDAIVEHKMASDWRHAAIRELHEAAGKPVPADLDNADRIYIGGFRFDIRAGGSVQLDGTVSPALAARIARLLVEAGIG